MESFRCAVRFTNHNNEDAAYEVTTRHCEQGKALSLQMFTLLVSFEYETTHPRVSVDSLTLHSLSGLVKLQILHEKKSSIPSAEKSEETEHHILWHNKKRMSDHQRGSSDVEQQQSRTSRRMSRAERRISRAVSVANDQSLDEYERLVKYVAVYREPGTTEAEEEDGEMKREWFAPWKKRWVPSKKAVDAKQRFPSEWLTTDIRQGLSETEVINRRHHSGWNELISHKENPVAKFISYFQGPILYGMSTSSVSFMALAKFFG